MSPLGLLFESKGDPGCTPQPELLLEGLKLPGLSLMVVLLSRCVRVMASIDAYSVSDRMDNCCSTHLVGYRVLPRFQGDVYR